MDFLKPEISKVIAAGGAGTWFTLGYIMYLLAGVVGVAVSAFIYYYFERVEGVDYSRFVITKVMAWVHFLLMNIGVIVSMGMLMYAGYTGGAAMLPASDGGRGFNAGQTHNILLAQFVEPIGAFILVLVVGVVAGGIGYSLAYKLNR
jgi:hypothetical protein